MLHSDTVLVITEQIQHIFDNQIFLFCAGKSEPENKEQTSGNAPL